MSKKFSLTFFALLLGTLLFAQAPTGGVKGTIVSRTDGQRIEKAKLILYQGANEVATVMSGEDGTYRQ